MSFLARAVAAFRVTVSGSGAQPDARSGAGVWAARTAAGEAAYLKVTPAGPGLDAARREFRVYREIALPSAPQLLDGLEDPAGVALLLADAGSPRAAAEWTEEMWAGLGVELGALHSLPVGVSWHSPAVEVGSWSGFWSGRLPRLPGRAELLAAASALPPVFLHGDCHTGNVLHRDGRLVLCDWQSAGVGRVASDLAFPSVRATPSGAVVPEALLDAYLAARRCDPDELRRAVLAEELLTFGYVWPAYAGLNTPAGIARVVDRTRDLVERWYG